MWICSLIIQVGRNISQTGSIMNKIGLPQFYQIYPIKKNNNLALGQQYAFGQF